MAKLRISAASLVLTTILSLSLAGIVTNQSESVSSSSSSSVSSTSNNNKPGRVGKVLYTAPYSNVRVTKHEERKLLQGQLRSFNPVLIKAKKMDIESGTTSTSTSTTTSPTTSTTTTLSPSTSSAVDDNAINNLSSEIDTEDIVEVASATTLNSDIN